MWRYRFWLLVEKFGGPSAKPYQPMDTWPAMNFPKRDTRQAVAKISIGAVSTRFAAIVPAPQLLTFDAPQEKCTIIA